jgi:hypothetical protein
VLAAQIEEMLRGRVNHAGAARDRGELAFERHQIIANPAVERSESLGE